MFTLVYVGLAGTGLGALTHCVAAAGRTEMTAGHCCSCAKTAAATETAATVEIAAAVQTATAVATVAVKETTAAKETAAAGTGSSDLLTYHIMLLKDSWQKS